MDPLERELRHILDTYGPSGSVPSPRQMPGHRPRPSGSTAYRDYAIRLQPFLRPFRDSFNHHVRDARSTRPDVWTTNYIRQLVSHVDYRNYALWQGEHRGIGNARVRTWRRFVELNMAGSFGHRRARAIENVTRRIRTIENDKGVPSLTLPSGGGHFQDVITGEEIRHRDFVLVSISTGAPAYRTTIEGIAPADMRFELGSMIKLNAKDLSAAEVAEIIVRAYENQNHDTILHQLPIALVITRVKYPTEVEVQPEEVRQPWLYDGTVLAHFRDQFNSTLRPPPFPPSREFVLPATNYFHQVVTPYLYTMFVRWRADPSLLRAYPAIDPPPEERTWRAYIQSLPFERPDFAALRLRAITAVTDRIPNIAADPDIPTVVLPVGGVQFEDVITREEIRNNDVVLICVTTPLPSPLQRLQISPMFEFAAMIKLNAEDTPVQNIIETVHMGYLNATYESILRQIPLAFMIARVQYPGPPGAAFGSRRIVHFGRFVDRYRKKRDCSEAYAISKYMRAMSLL